MENTSVLPIVLKDINPAIEPKQNNIIVLYLFSDWSFIYLNRDKIFSEEYLFLGFTYDIPESLLEVITQFFEITATQVHMSVNLNHILPQKAIQLILQSNPHLMFSLICKSKRIDYMNLKIAAI